MNRIAQKFCELKNITRKHTVRTRLLTPTPIAIQYRINT